MTDPTKLTRNQSLVVNALREAEAPLSAYMILDKLRDDGFRAPLQVYRALDKLMERGLVHRLESLNAFVACQHDHAHGEAHGHGSGVLAFAICEDCGSVAEIDDPAINARLSALAADRSFKTDKTTIEIRGHCRECTAVATA
ncbi:Fur family transcriptional regulator [Xaviernesmea oryzae]|uniref:Ferric uptake regulation protein n=1 Tax=Xaviernesmea oryzae TaxID=464029 RepID=A0A1Q9B0G9_9HYPH|nr:Fur family transcriptional regulator [Xaviernesmea oryzae]OLP61470.1 Fur family transcriptional regulator [Xaviernesmea oryzae]SEL68311.1 Fur family transcriptional regulator, zinc uptake regulator [Xaviernesmea oryzae]